MSMNNRRLESYKKALEKDLQDARNKLSKLKIIESEDNTAYRTQMEQQLDSAIREITASDSIRRQVLAGNQEEIMKTVGLLDTQIDVERKKIAKIEAEIEPALETAKQNLISKNKELELKKIKAVQDKRDKLANSEEILSNLTNELEIQQQALRDANETLLEIDQFITNATKDLESYKDQKADLEKEKNSALANLKEKNVKKDKKLVEETNARIALLTEKIETLTTNINGKQLVIAGRLNRKDAATQQKNIAETRIGEINVDLKVKKEIYAAIESNAKKIIDQANESISAEIIKYGQSQRNINSDAEHKIKELNSKITRLEQSKTKLEKLKYAKFCSYTYAVELQSMLNAYSGYDENSATAVKIVGRIEELLHDFMDVYEESKETKNDDQLRGAYGTVIRGLRDGKVDGIKLTENSAVKYIVENFGENRLEEFCKFLDLIDTQTASLIEQITQLKKEANTLGIKQVNSNLADEFKQTTKNVIEGNELTQILQKVTNQDELDNFEACYQTSSAMLGANFPNLSEAYKTILPVDFTAILNTILLDTVLLDENATPFFQDAIETLKEKHLRNDAITDCFQYYIQCFSEVENYSEKLKVADERLFKLYSRLLNLENLVTDDLTKSQSLVKSIELQINDLEEKGKGNKRVDIDQLNMDLIFLKTKYNQLRVLTSNNVNKDGKFQSQIIQMESAINNIAKKLESKISEYNKYVQFDNDLISDYKTEIDAYQQELLWSFEDQLGALDLNSLKKLCVSVSGEYLILTNRQIDLSPKEQQEIKVLEIKSKNTDELTNEDIINDTLFLADVAVEKSEELNKLEEAAPQVEQLPHVVNNNAGNNLNAETTQLISQSGVSKAEKQKQTQAAKDQFYSELRTIGEDKESQKINCMQKLKAVAMTSEGANMLKKVIWVDSVFGKDKSRLVQQTLSKVAPLSKAKEILDESKPAAVVRKEFELHMNKSLIPAIAVRRDGVPARFIRFIERFSATIGRGIRFFLKVNPIKGTKVADKLTSISKRTLQDAEDVEQPRKKQRTN